MYDNLVLDGTQLSRTSNLLDPKDIFEFIWNEFCLKIEQHGNLPPLIFFIRTGVIEIYNFAPFTANAEGKNSLIRMVSKRVDQEKDIEGVAITFEAMIQVIPFGTSVQGTQPKSAVMLSLDWRGIGSAFGRFAQKIEVNGEHKLIDIENTSVLMGGLANFFKDNVSYKERLNLQ